MAHRPLSKTGFGIVILTIGASMFIYVQAVSSQNKSGTDVVALTAEQVEITNGAISHRSLDRRITTAIRSDKSRATGAAPGDTSGLLRVITLRPEREIVTVDDKNRMKSTLFIAPVPAGTSLPAPVSPPQRRECERPQGAELLGERMIAGVNAIGYRHASKDPDGGTTTAEDWFGKALGCFVLESRAEYTGGDGIVKSTFQRSTVKLILGEPDPSFFSVPVDYSEVPPSAIEKQRLPSLTDASDSMKERWKKDDEKYYTALSDRNRR